MTKDPLADLLLQHEVEQFLYHEASLLDDRRYEDWLALLTDDIHYWMPVRRTTMARQSDMEFTRPGAMAFFDDDLDVLKTRVAKISAPNAWSEDPPSRTRHLVHNVRITGTDGDHITVNLNFHLFRSRLEGDEDNWFGRREDVLRRVDGTLRIARRHIYLDHTVILSQNMSNFF